MEFGDVHHFKFPARPACDSLGPWSLGIDCGKLACGNLIRCLGTGGICCLLIAIGDGFSLLGVHFRDGIRLGLGRFLAFLFSLAALGLLVGANNHRQAFRLRLQRGEVILRHGIDAPANLEHGRLHFLPAILHRAGQRLEFRQGHRRCVEVSHRGNRLDAPARLQRQCSGVEGCH